MPPNRSNANPIVFNKLCDIIKNPSIFSEISYEEVNGSHVVEGVVNDQFFTVTGKNEKAAKDDFALAVFRAYQQDKPIKSKVAESKCIGQMLCWSAEHTVQRFNKSLRFEYAGHQGNQVKVTVNEITRVKNEEGKTDIHKTEILSKTASNIHDAKFDAGIAVLNQDEFRDQYVNWVRNDKRGVYRKPKEGEEASTESQGRRDPGWTATDDGIEGEHAQQLREFCEKYGLPAPEYFLAAEDYIGGNKALCKIQLRSQNPNKEAACKVIYDVLLQICTEQSEARAAEREEKKEQQKADQDARRTAAQEAREAKKVRKQEHHERTQGKRKADKSGDASPNKKAKQEVAMPLAVYTQEMLVAGFGNQIEQFPILSLNEHIKKNSIKSSPTFMECAAPAGGFNTQATLEGMTAIGFAKSKKMSKNVAAQALLMTLRTAAQMPGIQSPGKKAKGQTPKAKGQTPKAKGQPPAKGTVVDQSPAQIANMGSQIFGQELSYETGDAEDTADGKVFPTSATFGEITVSAYGKSKKDSKTNAASTLIPAIEGKYGNIMEAVQAKKQEKAAVMKAKREAHLLAKKAEAEAAAE